MWERKADGRRRFMFGKGAPEKAVEAARACADFRADDEEEWINDDPKSCYNCRYRRWTQDSFDCLKRED